MSKSTGFSHATSAPNLRVRNIGVDLHRKSLTACFLSADGSERVVTYNLTDIAEFIKQLRSSDIIAVEATGNVRWFISQVSPLVAKVEVVNPKQFQVIRKSAQKSDQNDARALAKFSMAGILPIARLKDAAAVELESLGLARLTFVNFRKTLMNKLNAKLVAHNIVADLKYKNISARQSNIFDWEISPAERAEIEVEFRQIQLLTSEISRLEASIIEEGRKLNGFRRLVSIRGVGELSAALLLAVIGNISDFQNAKKLSSYFGVVPRVRNSGKQVRHGKITRNGSHLGRLLLIQCTQVAMRHDETLRSIYVKLRARIGCSKAMIATARRFLENIYQALKNEEDV